MTEPYPEPPALAALRFALEVIAWIAIYFAWGWPFLIVAVAVLSLLNVPGDKHVVAIPIPGKARIALELVVFTAGVAACYRIWRIPPAGALALAILIMMASSHRRMMFLWSH